MVKSASPTGRPVGISIEHMAQRSARQSRAADPRQDQAPGADGLASRIRAHSAAPGGRKRLIVVRRHHVARGGLFEITVTAHPEGR